MKKQKGKMKSEKVWTSLLLPFSLLLFTSAADAAEDVSYWDSDAKEEKTQTACQAITTSTTTLEDGWYVVTAKVSVALIEVKGAAHLILADGSQLKAENGGIRIGEKASLNIYGQTAGTGELIARGSSYPAPDSAGIGSCLNGAGGSVTINGGIVRATGAYNCAGIGAGGMATFDTVTINGGQVVATGSGYAAGIGGGLRSSFYEVKINGGTVTAQHGSTDSSGTVRCAPDIGRGVEGVDGPVMINGGSVKASEIRNAPKNKAGELLYKVTAECEGIGDLGLGIGVEGLDGYGTRDVYPVDGRVYLWLPDGTHRFTISDGPTTLSYCAIVKGRDVSVEPLGPVGFFVNGRDVSDDHDPTAGWSYINDVLTLAQKRDYVLSGAAMNNEVQINVTESDARVILSNAVVFTEGRSALVAERNASLLMAGDVSYLVATNNASAVTVAEGAKLTVDLGDGGDRLESMIGVFGSGEENAISGDGGVQVKGGTFVALADASAVGVKTFTCDADSVIMAVGDDPENARFASSAGASKYVLVAPFCRVLVPVEIPGIRSYVVADTTEPIAPSETVNFTNVFRLMVLDDVTVEFTADEGYEIVGGGCVTIPRITDDVTFGSEDLPVPDVRRQLTVTLPESLEGETYVVTEGEKEVEPSIAEATEGKGEGVAVYPVRSGYDVEIVCTAQEGWRIVSETNVVALANIQENKVLTAAELPQAWRLFMVKVPEMENARCILTSTDDLRTVTSDGSELILSNSEVTVTFVAVGNYRITANGEKTWTLTGDVTFGTTEGFPLPTFEGIPGTVAAPWPVGENVVAYTNEMGELTITGTGAMDDFADATDVPWDPDAVAEVTVEGGVTKLGANAFAALDDAVAVNGTTMDKFRFVAPALGPTTPAEPAGAISPAEFERIAIMDGKAYLDVSVYTNSEVKARGEGEGWGVATNGVIVVPAPGKQGFFYLMSKPGVPSDRGGAIVPDGGLPRIVLDEEKAKSELSDFHIGEGEDGEVTAVVNNVVVGLWYGIGRAKSQAGPYVVDEWVRATSASPLTLTAQKTGDAEFYKIMMRE